LTQLLIKKLTDDAIIPTRGSPKAIGLDLYAYIPESPSDRFYDSLLESKQRIRTLYFGEVLQVRTGIAVAIPEQHYGRIAPRSGLALRNGVNVLGGVIDEDYRGELIVLLSCAMRSANPLQIRHGERIAQLIIERATIPEIVNVTDLDTTDRGSGGFGSTGRN
jgi:dUTP pyrophosphatase